MANVMDLLSTEEVKRIGIWGMGGVGKTTLIKNINNKLTTPSPVSDSFGIVIWITVSNKTQETELELKKVQKLIADRMRLTLTEESMETRASKLHARLMMEKTFLLILDDVWNPIDLDIVGIPTPEVHQGGKLILTTRFSNVCLQMTEVTLKIEVLNEEEAWRLFCRSAGEIATLEELEPLARAVTKECAGLPLAIDVVGASLRGKRMIQLWNDALNALRRSEPLKRYWLTEGLLEEHHDIEEVMDRGVAIIETLIECSLLEQDNWSTVKIHDVIRDVSVWIHLHWKKSAYPLLGQE
ncbi:UNVERIFIED_CONTAM: Disease resistance protein [Sesamum angustifolium]|uniref:Disease resistance protein n=1 Tax=Sesamum angustifolium TaxID=2727405 RepID=A0AAW2RI17_9LAMI